MEASKASNPNPNPDMYTLPEITTFSMQPTSLQWGSGDWPWIEASKASNQNPDICFLKLNPNILTSSQ
jgi:hypothetical protein